MSKKKLLMEAEHAEMVQRAMTHRNAVEDANAKEPNAIASVMTTPSKEDLEL